LYGWNLVPIKLVFAANLLVAKQTFFFVNFVAKQTGLLQRTGEQKNGGRAIQMDSLLFGIFFVFLFFQKYMTSFKFCKNILLLQYHMAFGPNSHTTRQLEVL
jgi:hypothetical protein